MTTFAYRAARPDGEIVAGRVEAGSVTTALSMITRHDMYVVSISKAHAVPPRIAVGPAELAACFAGLAALLDTGVPVDRALAASRENASPKLATALAEAESAVREGAALSAALENSGAAPPLVIAYLRSAERSGTLAAAAAQAAEDLEREAETRARLAAALTYPAFLAVTGTVSVLAITGLVVPRFAELLDAQNRTLPATTQLLLAGSLLLSQFAVPVFAGLAVILVLTTRWARGEQGALAVHRRLLRLPLVGPARMALATSRACSALAGLLDGGVPMLAALDLAGHATGDRAIAERFDQARVDVERGEHLTAALKRHGALSPAALRLVAFGEQSGRVTAFLRHAGRLDAALAQRIVQRAVTLVEPVIIVAFGAVVAFVAAALLQAVYSVRPAGVG